MLATHVGVPDFSSWLQSGPAPAVNRHFGELASRWKIGLSLFLFLSSISGNIKFGCGGAHVVEFDS